jgi:hypothetical protein
MQKKEITMHLERSVKAAGALKGQEAGFRLM